MLIRSKSSLHQELKSALYLGIVNCKVVGSFIEERLGPKQLKKPAISYTHCGVAVGWPDKRVERSGCP
ncbi:MAG: hypothetical protein ABI325_04560 [Ginsengibacter sp.]